MKHTEIPFEMTARVAVKDLQHGDKLIYAAIRRCMNKDTRECYPSFNTICNKLHCSKTRISGALNRLIKLGFIEKRTKGRSNVYYFPKTEFDKRFEMFTDEFLDLDMDLSAKEFYMDIQQFLYGKESGIGKCAIPETKLAELTGWSVPSVRKYKSILKENGYLTEEESDITSEDGSMVVVQNYDLNSLHQASLWVRQITEQVISNTEDINEMKRTIDELRQRINLLENKPVEFSF